MASSHRLEKDGRTLSRKEREALKAAAEAAGA